MSACEYFESTRYADLVERRSDPLSDPLSDRFANATDASHERIRASIVRLTSGWAGSGTTLRLPVLPVLPPSSSPSSRRRHAPSPSAAATGSAAVRDVISFSISTGDFPSSLR